MYSKLKQRRLSNQLENQTIQKPQECSLRKLKQTYSIKVSKKADNSTTQNRYPSITGGWMKNLHQKPF